MSYCRWSSMDFGCDLYCYESDQGFETWVAANRVVGEVPHIDYLATPEVMARQYNEQSRFLATAEHAPIGLPHDGEFFCDGDLASFEQRLRQLRVLGYRFPHHIFNAVWEEMGDEMSDETFSKEAMDEVISQFFPSLPARSLLRGKLYCLFEVVRQRHHDTLAMMVVERMSMGLQYDLLVAKQAVTEPAV